MNGITIDAEYKSGITWVRYPDGREFMYVGDGWVPVRMRTIE